MGDHDPDVKFVVFLRHLGELLLAQLSFPWQATASPQLLGQGVSLTELLHASLLALAHVVPVPILPFPGGPNEECPLLTLILICITLERGLWSEWSLRRFRSGTLLS